MKRAVSALLLGSGLLQAGNVLADGSPPGTAGRFDIKGLGLQVTRGELQAGWNGRWTCAGTPDDPDVERCRLSLPTTTCDNRLADSMTTCRGPREKLQASLLEKHTERFMTVAGYRVGEIEISFFRSTAHRIEIRQEGNLSEVAAALRQKFGPAGQESHRHVQWVGADEEFVARGDPGVTLVMTRPSLQRELSERAEARERAESERKKALVRPPRKDL